MKIFSVLVAVSLMALSAVFAVDVIEHVDRALVVDGSTTEIGSKLFTSGIRHENDGKSYCVGVLVSPIHVLTTVQFVLDGGVYTALVDTATWKSKFVAIGTHYLNGKIDGEEIKVESALNHTLWINETRAYNFAILTLEKASKFTPIKFDKADNSDFVAGMSATAL